MNFLQFSEQPYFHHPTNSSVSRQSRKGLNPSSDSSSVALYDVLPSGANPHRQTTTITAPLQQSANAETCSFLVHCRLKPCTSSGRYTWRHNRMLLVLVKRLQVATIRAKAGVENCWGAKLYGKRCNHRPIL